MWKEQIDFRKMFDDIDKEFSTTKEMLSRMFRTIREGDVQSLESNLPYYYGYQINVGPDGKPHFREFGNVRPTTRRLIEQSEIKKPLVDTNFNEKENTYVVTAEMPGVTKEDIKVSVSQQTVTIKADRGGKKYLAEIPLDVELDDASTKATYTNGIVEIKIRAKDQPKLKSKEIKVE
jgi:HSP20 family protein